MRIVIIAVGRLKTRPERALFEDYRTRFDRLARSLGLQPLVEHEIDTRDLKGAAAEARAIRQALPEKARLVVLDERGSMLSSADFALKLERAREAGTSALAFVIGGADGVDPVLRTEADWVLSLGPMVWPHALVRVMLAEQLYRAASILAGLPYHRR